MKMGSNEHPQDPEDYSSLCDHVSEVVGWELTSLGLVSIQKCIYCRYETYVPVTLPEASLCK
jgi:hypothetical protein